MCSAPEISKIERAKALRAVKSVVTDEEYSKLRSIIAPNDGESVDRAIHGLAQEDEFALMCRLMGTATHLVPLEQRPIIPGDSIVPDFMARFQPGCRAKKKLSSEHDGFRCFVEVKSTEEMKYKISGANLRKRRAFADEFGLPLLFAVRFLKFNENALWIIVEDNDRSSTSLEVTVADLTEGVRHVLWDDYLVTALPSIHLRAVFDKEPLGKFEGVRHVEYGTLTEFHIVSDPDRPIYGANVVNNAARYFGRRATTLSAFFEGFHAEETDAYTDGTITTQFLRPTLPCSLSDLIFIYNRLARDEGGNVIMDPSRILVDSESSTGLADREFIERVASDLWASVLGLLTFGDSEKQLLDWERFGGCRDKID